MTPKYPRRIIETSKTTTAPYGAHTTRKMHVTINRTQFHHRMLDDKYSSYSGEALNLIWDYYEQLEEDIRESIAFDPVAIRCEWTEDSVEETLESYGYLFDVEGGASILELIEHLQGYTTVLGTTTDDKIIYQSF